MRAAFFIVILLNGASHYCCVKSITVVKGGPRLCQAGLAGGKLPWDPQHCRMGRARDQELQRQGTHTPKARNFSNP